MTALPQAFLERMKARLGNEFDEFLRSYDEPYQRGIRFNPHKRMDADVSGAGEQVPWEDTGRYLSVESDAGAQVLHDAGAYYLQEPSAMLPAAVLNARPGEHILDLCAAPGGKTTQSALRMNGQGTIICNEPIRDRAKILSRNVERMGIPNAVVVSAWPEQLAKCWPEAFDAIQCDAPCSGEGMFRRHPETREEWTAESPAGCAKRQSDILDSAAVMLRPGGRLVYSTCTLNEEENEGVIQAFLQRHADFSLMGFSLPGADAPDGTLTCYPHRMQGEGHFVALLKKQGDAPGMAWAVPEFAPKERALAASLTQALPKGHGANSLREIAPGEYLLSRVPELPQGGLPRNVLRTGLHLGTVKISRNGKTPVFTPDHAWAMSILPPDVPHVDLTHEQARNYQQGQTIETSGKGWVLACFAGIPLGWGKISDGVMKNHYPKGIRR